MLTYTEAMEGYVSLLMTTVVSKRRDTSTYLLLCRLRVEDSVELEWLLGVWWLNLGIRRELKAAFRATVVATSAEHANVAAQVLQLANTNEQTIKPGFHYPS